MIKRQLMLTVFTLVIVCGPAFGHAGEKHDNDSEGWETVGETVPQSILDEINKDYTGKVKPIFRKKCLDCHGSGNILPWYSNIPGPKQLIENDIEEAKEHMDMTNDFPFEGHGTPRDDLEALERTLRENTMPPFQYWILHWRSSLSEYDKQIINSWIKNSLGLLEQSKTIEEEVK